MSLLRGLALVVLTCVGYFLLDLKLAAMEWLANPRREPGICHHL
jgi:hypothetical protein